MANNPALVIVVTNRIRKTQIVLKYFLLPTIRHVARRNESEKGHDSGHQLDLRVSKKCMQHLFHWDINLLSFKYSLERKSSSLALRKYWNED